MRTCLKLICGLLILSIISCKDEDGTFDAFSEVFEFAEGETITLRDTQQLVLAVVNDSRCPINADCAWEGRGRVLLTWVSDFEALSDPIELNDVDKRTATRGTYTFEFLELGPFPGTQEDDAGEPKVLKLKVSRGL